MTEYGDYGEDKVLRFTRLFPGPIDRVWAYLTDAAKRAEWLCGGDDITAAGATIKFDFHHKNLTPHDDPYPEQYKEMEGGVCFDVNVVVFEPPHLLKIHWPGAEGGDDSVVVFRLSECEGGVRLDLEQTRIPSADDLYGAAAGWHTHFAIMTVKLSANTPDAFWPMHERLTEDYRARFADAVSDVCFP